MTTYLSRLAVIEAAIEVLKREDAPETPMAILESWLEIERRFERAIDHHDGGPASAARTIE